jgi:hypothetical protein
MYGTQSNGISQVQLFLYSQGYAINRLNAFNPINPGEVGYIYADDDWFQTAKIEIRSAYMYDAVMSVGIGACLAEQDVDGTVSSAQHQEHVRKSVFTGATGPVAFGNEATKTDVQGGRLNSTLIWAGMNMLPPQPDGDKVVKYALTKWSVCTGFCPFRYSFAVLYRERRLGLCSAKTPSTSGSAT